MHHHVFTTRSVAELCRAAKLEVVLLRARTPFNVFALCRSATNGGAAIDARELHRALGTSPFPSDRADLRRLPPLA
jgi:hypothetical protein